MKKSTLLLLASVLLPMAASSADRKTTAVKPITGTDIRGSLEESRDELHRDVVALRNEIASLQGNVAPGAVDRVRSLERRQEKLEGDLRKAEDKLRYMWDDSRNKLTRDMDSIHNEIKDLRMDATMQQSK